MAMTTPSATSPGAVWARRRTATRIITRAVGLGLGALLALTACSAEGSDAERFCGEIALDPVALVSPLVTDEEQLTAALDHYAMLTGLAPVDIAEEMTRILLALEAAAAVDPADEDSIQMAALTAYASEASAVRLATWVRDWCGVDLGPVTTITPQGPTAIPQEPSGPSISAVPAGRTGP